MKNLPLRICHPVKENRRNKSKSCAVEIWDCPCVADFPDCAMRGGTACAGKRERTAKTVAT